MSRVGVERGSLIRLAQKAKTEIIQGKESSVKLPFAMAALAFGVSIPDLSEMSRAGQSLIIQSQEDGVVVSLESSVTNWRRDLWDEMLGTLEQGRGQTGMIKDAYSFVIVLAQAVATNQTEILGAITPPQALQGNPAFMKDWENLKNGGSLEGDEEFLQVLAYALFGALPDGTKRELLPPELVLGPVSC